MGFLLFTAGTQHDPRRYFITSITMELWSWKKQSTEWVNESCSMNKMTTWEKKWEFIEYDRWSPRVTLPKKPHPSLFPPRLLSVLHLFLVSSGFSTSFFPIFHPFQEKRPSLHLHMSPSSKTWPLTGRWMTATDYLAQYMMLLRSIKVYSILSRKATRKTGGGGRS